MIAALMCGGEAALPTTVLAAVAAAVTGVIVAWHRKRLQLLKSLHNVAICRRSSTAPSPHQRVEQPFAPARPDSHGAAPSTPSARVYAWVRWSWIGGWSCAASFRSWTGGYQRVCIRLIKLEAMATVAGGVNSIRARCEYCITITQGAYTGRLGMSNRHIRRVVAQGRACEAVECVPSRPCLSLRKGYLFRG